MDNDAPERIFICEHVGEYGQYFPKAVEAEGECGGTAVAYIPERALFPAAVTVKPLEWMDSDCGRYQIANSPTGIYEVGADGDGWWAQCDAPQSWDWTEASQLSQEHEAKAAAQSEHERRLLSGINFTPAPVAPAAVTVTDFLTEFVEHNFEEQRCFDGPHPADEIASTTEYGPVKAFQDEAKYLLSNLTLPHLDDQAVDRFAAAMKVKLADARDKGRSGWDDPELCSAEFLASLLSGHIGKGNPGNFEDIANLCMMLHQREADPAILTPAPVAPAAVTVKPLEWEEESLRWWKRGRCAAKSPVSYGWAAYIKRVDAGWEYAGKIYFADEGGLDAALDRAKAAAQTNYQHRILSALTPAPVAEPDAPDWEAFGRSLLDDGWPAYRAEIDGLELMDLCIKHRIVREVPGGFDPDQHTDHEGVGVEPGDKWYEYNFSNTISAATDQQPDAALRAISGEGE